MQKEGFCGGICLALDRAYPHYYPTLFHTCCSRSLASTAANIPASTQDCAASKELMLVWMSASCQDACEAESENKVSHRNQLRRF